MSRNLFTIAGALAALALLISSPFLGLASAEGTTLGAAGEYTPPGLPTSVMVGQIYNVNLRDYLDSDYDPWFNGDAGYDLTFNYLPSWLFIQGAERVDPLNDANYRIVNGHLTLVGTAPEVVGTHPLSISWYGADGGARMDLFVHWDLDVVVIPPDPHMVTLISDPVPEPTSISTSAGTVSLTGGSATILGGTIMQEPALAKDRYIIHRWTDAAGNTYDWSKPVSSDLTLTADWREHFTASVTDNTATVTISSDLPTEYTTHKVDWGDNTVNSELTHRYAVPGIYVIKVTSGQWSNTVTSSTSAVIERVTVVPTYTISFSGNGSASQVPSQTVEYGAKATAPAEPTRSNYTFTGWYRAGVLYDFSAPVTGDLLLTAGWVAVQGSGDDKDDDKDEPGNNLLLIALTALSIIGLAVTLLTRSPYAFVVTVVLALIELALLMLGIFGVIA